MDEKMFDLMSKMYSEMQDMKVEMQDMKVEMQEGFKRIDVLENGMQNMQKSIAKIEVEHGKKLDALFDGYKQNSEQLTRIENEVKRHDDFILRRVN